MRIESLYPSSRSPYDKGWRPSWTPPTEFAPRPRRTAPRHRGTLLMSRFRCTFPAAPRSALIALSFLAIASPVRSAPPVEYNRDVRPILSDNCFYCHGPDKNQRKAKLRLDIREEALKKEAFVPGQPEKSELVRRIFASDPEDMMPPPKSNKKLDPTQRATLR